MTQEVLLQHPLDPLGSAIGRVDLELGLAIHDIANGAMPLVFGPKNKRDNDQLWQALSDALKDKTIMPNDATELIVAMSALVHALSQMPTVKVADAVLDEVQLCRRMHNPHTLIVMEHTSVEQSPLITAGNIQSTSIIFNNNTHKPHSREQAGKPNVVAKLELNNDRTIQVDWRTIATAQTHIGASAVGAYLDEWVEDNPFSAAKPNLPYGTCACLGALYTYTQLRQLGLQFDKKVNAGETLIRSRMLTYMPDVIQNLSSARNDVLSNIMLHMRQVIGGESPGESAVYQRSLRRIFGLVEGDRCKFNDIMARVDTPGYDKLVDYSPMKLLAQAAAASIYDAIAHQEEAVRQRYRRSLWQ